MKTFREEVKKIDISHRCVQSVAGQWNLPIGDIYFGVPESEFFGWICFNELSEKISGMRFYLGADNVELIESFSRSEYPDKLQRLSIGDSSFSYGKGRNYEKLTNILTKANYPQLREFEYGIWKLYSNSHGMYGKLGDITNLLTRMPALERLSLFGAYKLEKPLHMPNLKYLKIKLDDGTTGENGGYINQNSLDNMLSSNFPKLTEAMLDLECEQNNYDYVLNEIFMSGLTAPNLRSIILTGGYKKGEVERLERSRLGNQCGKNLQFW